MKVKAFQSKTCFKTFPEPIGSYRVVLNTSIVLFKNFSRTNWQLQSGLEYWYCTFQEPIGSYRIVLNTSIVLFKNQWETF